MDAGGADRRRQDRATSTSPTPARISSATSTAQSDYSDYSFFYDTIVGYGARTSTTTTATSSIRRSTSTARTATPRPATSCASPPNPEARVRFVGGLFYQRQTHDIQQDYKIDGLADDSDVTGWDDTFWLTKQWRVDRDYAVFGEVTFDVTDRFTLTGGLR